MAEDFDGARIRAAVELVRPELPEHIKIWELDGRCVFTIRNAEGEDQGYAVYLYTDFNKRPYKFGVELGSDPSESVRAGVKEFQQHLDGLQG